MHNDEFVLLLNAAGQNLPSPVIDTERALSKTQRDEAIRVWSTDPSFEEEIRRRLGRRYQVQIKTRPLPDSMATPNAAAGEPATRLDIRV